MAIRTEANWMRSKFQTKYGVHWGILPHITPAGLVWVYLLQPYTFMFISQFSGNKYGNKCIEFAHPTDTYLCAFPRLADVNDVSASGDSFRLTKNHGGFCLPFFWKLSGDNRK